MSRMMRDLPHGDIPHTAYRAHFAHGTIRMSRMMRDLPHGAIPHTAYRAHFAHGANPHVAHDARPTARGDPPHRVSCAFCARKDPHVAHDARPTLGELITCIIRYHVPGIKIKDGYVFLG